MDRWRGPRFNPFRGLTSLHAEIDEAFNAYFGVRPRLIAFDIGVAIIFAIFSVATMNALLSWHDNIPLLPQGRAAWRETSFYALSIGASMFSGMLLRVTQAALAARGLVSLPELRKGLLSVTSSTVSARGPRRRSARNSGRRPRRATPRRAPLPPPRRTTPGASPRTRSSRR